MEIAETTETPGGQRARCRLQLPAATERHTRRGGADSGSAGFWRPWVEDSGEEEEAPHHAAEAMPDGPGITDASEKLSRYRHPVRLFWPKSKCYDYLYQEAEALLKKFPIQATISFYEDSDSEEEIEELICEN
ncbi:protein ripply2 [Phocoena sinus]|uniref:protein ripply2 n=1 Tax=Phocoena sinus TaxID=42100 RepID=UPI0013C4305B|nr:protein ripply2 [Phocoena sinus]